MKFKNYKLSKGIISLILFIYNLAPFIKKRIEDTALAASSALICTMAVNLNLTPVLLLIFGKFLSKCQWKTFGWKRRGDRAIKLTG